MRFGSREWQVAAVAGGLGLAGIAGVWSLSALGPRDAAIWTALLAYVFALAYGANRLQLALLKPPGWKSSFVGVVCFLPMFLGWFPASGWLQGLGYVHGWSAVPSPLWILAVMMWGLLAPGGVYVQVYEKWAEARRA